MLVRHVRFLSPASGGPRSGGGRCGEPSCGPHSTYRFPFVALIWIGLAASLYSSPQDGGEKSQKAKATSIGGRVVNLAGAPVAKALVTAESATSEAGQSARSYVASTSGDGKFTLTGLDAGSYRLTVERTGYLRKVFGSQAAEGEGTSITLTPGQQVTDVVLNLTPEDTIAGRVLDEDRDPVANVNVQLFSYTYHLGIRRPQVLAQSETDSGGAFRLTGIGPGRYYMLAIPRKAVVESSALPSGERIEYSYTPTYFPASADAFGAQPIAISPGDSSTAGDLVLQKARILHVRGRVDAGTFSGDTGHLAVHAVPDDRRSAVQLFDTPTAQVSTKNGTFDLVNVTPGRYILMVTAAVGRIRILGQENVVVSVRDVEDAVVALLGGEVAGNLAYSAVKSAPDYPEEKNNASRPYIILLPEGPGSIATTEQRVRNGSFLFRDVSPGRYQVRAMELPTDVYVQGIRSAGGEDLVATDLDLTRGGRHAITVTLGRSPASLEGSVVNDDGQPLANIIVTSAPKSPNPRQADRYRRAVSDQTGHFTMQGFPPGDYCFYAWKELAEGDEFDDELLQREAGRCTGVELQESVTRTVQLTFRPANAPR